MLYNTSQPPIRKYFPFTQYIFCSMLIEQVIHKIWTGLRKVRFENLNFQTDLQDQDMHGVDGWSVTQLMAVADCSKNLWIKNSKLAQLMYVQETVSMVLCTTTWSGCAVLLESEQTPFLRQVVYLDRCSGFYSELSDLFLYLLQDQEMMESLRQAMCAALVCNKFL